MQAKLPGGNGHLSPNLHINEIAYLGAHNSPMSKCYGWKYTQQNVSITEQFEKHGARHFKFPLHWHLEKGVPQVFFIQYFRSSLHMKEMVDPIVNQVSYKDFLLIQNQLVIV
ncbi:unnamed protein product [Paramecium octaurelia]|uniref:Uncharacterized protein n=1 Tax=Paramecium octaurelia TaxID=43137 RepID=A0A8S1XML2_PAROT|nr:unnamed protein product [Paramecium octaurelia]